MDDTKIVMAETHARYAEMQQMAKDYVNGTITNPTQSDYTFALNCMLMGASIAIVGLEKFKLTMMAKKKN